MRFLWRLMLLAALALATAAVSGPAVAQQGFHDSAQIEDSRDRVLGDSRYQTERPAPEEPDDKEPLRIPPWLVKTVLWTVGIVVAGLVLYFLVNLLLDLLNGRRAFGRDRGKTPAPAAVVETPVTLDAETRIRTLAEADALASEGRFAEAIHLLLLVALERLRRELGPRVAPAMTSREVLRLTPVPGAARDPLARMVALCEIKHFGGRAAGAPDYRTCRRDFLLFSGQEPAGA
ncbi:MAG: DUF4129 domain-containing protein [Kiloniellaceae bacterium]